MTNPPPRDRGLPSPLLNNGQGGSAWSDRFRDTYFDQADGLAESRHVFLEGCSLPSEWRNKETFVIGETGFGTGLNFLATWDLWQRTQPKNGLLHYVSVEGFPLTAEEMTSCLAPFEELAKLSRELIETYPERHRGFHRLFFDNNRIILTLLFDDVETALSDLSATVDAWFLDGFAPSKNPDMWTPAVLNQVGRLSRPGTRVATFSVAGAVREGLTKAGFTIAKRSGAGRKREVLAGRYEGAETFELSSQPWFDPPQVSVRSGARVTIVGGGLAGAYTAQAFSKRGCFVTVFESGGTLASGASAAPRAIVMPRLSLGQSAEETFYDQAWRHTLTTLASANAAGTEMIFTQVGAVACALSPTQLDRFCSIADSFDGTSNHCDLMFSEEVSDLSGLSVDHSGLHIPEAGTVDAALLCEWLTRTSCVRANQPVAAIRKGDGPWSVRDQDADIVVLANSFGVTSFVQAHDLTVTTRFGQLTGLAHTQASQALRTVLVGDAHLTPSMSGHHVAGATFDHVALDTALDQPLQPSPDADQRNLTNVSVILPGLFTEADINRELSWIGLRCVTPDHLPLAGPVPNHPAYKESYADLHHGRHWKTYPTAPYHQGLFVLTGLGARGHLTAPLAAELIACQALGEPLPVPRRVADALHPGRFAIRSLKRGTLYSRGS